MHAPEVGVATPADRTPVVDALVAAFVTDPVVRFFFSDDESYARSAAVLFGHLFDKQVVKGTVWTVERGAATAIWEPPVAGTAILDDGRRPALPDDALRRVHAYDQALRAVLPRHPHWYLGILGTHPAHAGRRLGRAAMSAGLRRAADDGLPAVLETGNPVNVEIYRRAGWELVDTLTDPIPVWVMRR
ncbi:GNAT family N-acetyltransferase [Micromonospora sp. NPDC002389]|uniref:GNAT family N-acetyltransferase n=1 Tax=Micromonospora sp. NPDC002389 TaxID=3154272 RepID=UPI00333294E2